MATLAATHLDTHRGKDLLSGTPRAGFIDRWIYVFTAASFVVITLTGFIPDSLGKIAAVQAGARPPFPLVLHVHAALMGVFLLLLLSQTVLMATGRRRFHQQLGAVTFGLAAVLVLVGFVLVPTMYHETWNAAQAAPPAAREKFQKMVFMRDNIMLLQLRIGILFPLFLLIGVRARALNAGLHKRMIILATAIPLAAAIDRITWLPTSFPASPFATDLYTLLAISPMFFWDVFRNRSVHPAYLIWLGLNLPFAAAVDGLWGSPWWYAIAPRLMGV